MTELSSVSGLRGVREALEQCKESLDSIWAAIGDALCSGRGIETLYANKVAAECRAASDAARAALSLPPSPQPPDNRDFKRPEGLYLKFSEPLMEPNTPVIIERVNGDCTVSQFIIARDEAYELIDQLRELLAAPAGAQGQVQGVQHSLRGRLKEAIKEREIAERVATAVTIAIRRPDWDQPEWREWVIGCIEDELLNIGDEGFAKAYDQGFDNGLKEAMSEAPPADVSSQAGEAELGHCLCGRDGIVSDCPQHGAIVHSATPEKGPRETKEQYEARMLWPDLTLRGKATDHIWCMEDVEGYIGVRMDCGDAGTVYLTKAQAASLAEQLTSLAAPSAGSGQEGLASGLVWSGPQGHLATCKYPSGGDCDCGWLFYCRRPINRAALLPPASKPAPPASTEEKS